VRVDSSTDPPNSERRGFTSLLVTTIAVNNIHLEAKNNHNDGRKKQHSLLLINEAKIVSSRSMTMMIVVVE
jgi:hypothetical protein